VAVKSLRDLQSRVDLARADLDNTAALVTALVRDYHRRPSPGKHRQISRAVSELLTEQGGRP